MTKRNIAHRPESAVAAVLPHAVRIRRIRQNDRSAELEINGQPIRVRWTGEGGLRQARELIADQKDRPDIAAARRMSPGAREALSAEGIGWVDETGAAEIMLDSLIVSKSGRPPVAEPKPPRWMPSVLATVEALFCGELATVSSIQRATGLSIGGATNALRTLADFGLISSVANRGRDSARQISDPDRLLDEYAIAAVAMKPATALAVGATWRDFVEGLSKTGRRLDQAGIAWAATGTVASSVLAPYLTTVMAGEIYVDARTIAELESAAARAGLQPIEGGRLTLRPFPTVATKELATMGGGLRLAPWPRAYADLRTAGVRGEEAAEQLREVSWRPIMDIEIVKYEPRRHSAEVAFNIFGKKYVQEVSVTEGGIMPDRSYWIENKDETIKKALGLLLWEHKELVDNLHICKAIQKMRDTLSHASD